MLKAKSKYNISDRITAILENISKSVITPVPVVAGRRSAAARLLRSWVRTPPWHGCLNVVSVVCCQVEVSATADHSSRGVLPTVVRRCV